MPTTTGRQGNTIHYELRGPEHGLPVVFIQGLGLSSRYWADQPTLAAEAGRRVLVVDNRGTGGSSKGVKPFTVGDMADDVAAALSHAGLARAAVVGISMGGMIAQELALRHPARVSALLLLATTPGFPHATLPSPRTLFTLARMPMWHAQGRSREVYRQLFFNAREEHEAQAYLDTLLASWGPLLKEDRIAPRDFALQLRAAALHSTGFRLSRIACPTHAVAGEGDVVIPPRNALVLAKNIRGATAELLPRVGHAIPVEEPDVVLRSLRRLERVDLAA